MLETEGGISVFPSLIRTPLGIRVFFCYRTFKFNHCLVGFTYKLLGFFNYLMFFASYSWKTEQRLTQLLKKSSFLIPEMSQRILLFRGVEIFSEIMYLLLHFLKHVGSKLETVQVYIKPWQEALPVAAPAEGVSSSPAQGRQVKHQLEKKLQCLGPVPSLSVTAQVRPHL